MLVYEGYSILFQYAYSLDVLPCPNKIGSVPRIPICRGCPTCGRWWVSQFLRVEATGRALEGRGDPAPTGKAMDFRYVTACVI